MPRRKLDPSYKEAVRLKYFGAKTTEARKRVIAKACKESKYTYGGLMRALDLKVRTRALSEAEKAGVEYINKLGRIVWEYQVEHTKGTRSINTSIALTCLKEQKAIPDTVSYSQISEAIRKQRLKNKSQSYFTRFEHSEPLSMFQMDFTRSDYLEHVKKNGISYLRITRSKGANATRERVWIAVALDDSTRVTYARYYLAKGESSALAQRFLLLACKQKTIVDKKTGELKPIPLLQGQPKHLYTDRGSAFRNTTFSNGLRKLGIHHIMGSNAIDTQGSKRMDSNKQGRGKVERMIRFIKDDFETGLFLTYPEGTLFSVKEMNRLFKDWLLKINTSAHPEFKVSTRWWLFKPELERALYPPEEAELLFSTSVWKKVIRRQVRVADGLYCKVPPEINAGETIEIITVGANYYSILKGKRILLEIIPRRARTIEKPEVKKKGKKEFAEDFLKGMPLRLRLNKEIEERSRQQHNIGTLTELAGEDIVSFTSEHRSVTEIQKFVTLLLLKAEKSENLSISGAGALIESEIPVISVKRSK